MADLDQVIFQEHLVTLKETSADFRNGLKTVQYMTESQLQVIDFDAVKNEYSKPLQLREVPKSNDALFEADGHVIAFVEFKNGKLDRKDRYEICRKIYDSILILSDLTSLKLSDIRQRMIYILVYNEHANINNANVVSPAVQEKSKKIDRSLAMDGFAREMMRLSKQEYIILGLNKFQNYCFKEVHTYTQKEFEDYLKKLFANGEK